MEQGVNKSNLQDIEKLTNVINLESAKNTLSDQVREIENKQKSFYGTIKNYDENNDFISERLKNYSMEELEVKLKNDKSVEEFFIDPITNEPLDMSISFGSYDKEIEFKRGLLVYFKSSEELYKKIDEEYDKLDKATLEMQQDVSEVTKTLSDNVLSYISMMTDKAEAVQDKSIQRKMKKSIKYIRSAYDMEIFNEVIDKYPSVIIKCKNELIHDASASEIGRRYSQKLKSNGVKSSLISFISDVERGTLSIEENFLVSNLDIEWTPDLLVYSFIRFFAIQSWDDDVRRAHSSVCLMLRKLTNNEFDEGVKADIILAMTTYLNKFHN